MQTYKSIIIFGTLIILISIFFGIGVKKVKNPKWFKYSFYFTLLGFIISMNTFLWIFFHFTTDIIFSKIQFAIVFIQMIYGFYLFNSFKIDGVKNNRITKILFICVSLIYVLLLLLSFWDNNYETYLVPLPVIGYIAGVYNYFRNLFRSLRPINITKSPEFWIVIGFAFHSFVGFPVYTLYKFIYALNKDNFELRQSIFSLANISLIILYLFITKAYLCYKKLKQVIG